MTNEDIIRMAEECDALITQNGQIIADCMDVEAFAALVAAAEREACAQVCDSKVDAEYATGKVDHNEMGWTQSCAIAIRARGQE